MKIALYLENRNIASADLSRPEAGNPGVGGTQYLISAFPYYYRRYFPSGHQVILYANHTNHLAASITTRKAESIFEAVSMAAEDGCDLFIYRPVIIDRKQGFYEHASKLPVKLVAWAHNTPDDKTLAEFARMSNAGRMVCVSQEQLDRLRDHRVFAKSSRIFNWFDTDNFRPKDEVVKVQKSVAFLGALTPTKGFHKLAKCWKYVLQELPDAKLFVFGTGKLYDEKAVLGSWGIAEESYERQFRLYLSGANGEKLRSVHFEGLLSANKAEILSSMQLGVANPTGKSENCPGSALEFQALGVPVISGPYKGLLDTVIDEETGLLRKTPKELAQAIVTLLEDDELRLEYGENAKRFVKKKFNPALIMEEWNQLFYDLENDLPAGQYPVKQFIWKDFKWWREGVRKVKTALPFFHYLIPSIISTKWFFKRLLGRG